MRIYENGELIGGYVGYIPPDYKPILAYRRWIKLPDDSWFEVDPAKEVTLCFTTKAQ